MRGPIAARFVLAGHALRHDHVSIIDGPRQIHGEADSGFPCRLAHVHLHAVSHGLLAGAGVNDFAERRFVF